MIDIINIIKTLEKFSSHLISCSFILKIYFYTASFFDALIGGSKYDA